MPIGETASAHTNAAGRGASMVAGGTVRFTLALIYAFALCYAYSVLSVWWAYFGFTYTLEDDAYRYAVCFLAAIPAILLVPRPSTFAQASGWFIYALVFIPCIIVPVMQFSSTSARLVQVVSVTFIACVVFLLIVRGDVKRFAPPKIGPRAFWGAVLGIWAAMMLGVLISFRGSFDFVGVDDIYTQRFAGAETAANPIVRYSVALLSSAINPFLIATGLFKRRYWVAALGTFGQVFLFGTLAAKAVLLSPLFVLGTFLLADRQGNMRSNFLLVGLIAVFVITSPLLATYNPLGGGLNQLTTLLYLRTLLISGATYGVYEQFFALFPITYYSNNNIFSLFISYPYADMSVGQAVQNFLIPSHSVEMGELNANFLATDGMAALGVFGVPLASGVAAALFRLMSRFVARERTMLMISGGTGFLLSVANTSLFTSLVSGGGIVLAALVFLAPLERD